ncbi:MAG: hypothetical protein U0X39_10735 [Bacteroidales bacterium]
MKKAVLLFVLLAASSMMIMGQKVANFSYKLENGINVNMDRTWGHVWVQQQQAAFAPNEEQQSVVVNLRSFGDLTKGTVTKLTSNGKESKMKDAAPGTYDMKVTTSLSGKPGSISFDINGIVVKPKMKTTVTVTIYDYQISIEEAPAPNKGLASYDSRVIRYKGNTDVNPNCGIPSFYAKGAKDKAITPDEKASDLTGKIKPGNYDVQLVIDACGHVQKIWLENFTMKADINYKITVNLNAGEISYGGITRDVKKMHMYPSGTADKLQGVAKPDKNSEIGCYDPATSKFACPPGSYDVLVASGTGPKYEWKKNIVVRTGQRTDVK